MWKWRSGMHMKSSTERSESDCSSCPRITKVDDFLFDQLATGTVFVGRPSHLTSDALASAHVLLAAAIFARRTAARIALSTSKSSNWAPISRQNVSYLSVRDHALGGIAALNASRVRVLFVPAVLDGRPVDDQFWFVVSPNWRKTEALNFDFNQIPSGAVE